MKTLLAAAAFALGACLSAAAQESSQSAWVETRFHRVHLRNGNFIDGHMIQQTPKSIVLAMKSAGDFVVRRDLVDRVEFIKMRSLREEPPIVLSHEPALETDKAPAVAASAAKAAPAPTSTRIPNEVRRAVDDILRTHALATPDFRVDLALRIRSAGPAAMAYACWIARDGRAGIEMPALIDAIGQFDHAEATPALLAITSLAADSFERAAGVRALARRGGPEAVAAIHRALADPAGAVWRAAAEEVVKLAEKDQADVDAVVALLQAQHDKSVIALTLGKIGGAKAIEALQDLLREGATQDRIAALRGLALLRRPEDGAPARALLDDPDAALRRETCLFLGKVKHGAAVRDLIDALKDEDETVVESAVWSLRQITSQPYAATPALWESWWVQAGRAKFPPAEGN